MKTLIEIATALQGKEFVEGWQDCFTAVCDLFSEYCDLEIKQYSRPRLWFMNPELNFMDKLYQEEGFIEVSDNPNAAKVGDVLFMRMGRADCSNHLGVYVGGNKIYHHLTDQKSLLVDYDQKWRSRVVRIARHDQVNRKVEGNVKPIIMEVPYGVKAKIAWGNQ